MTRERQVSPDEAVVKLFRRLDGTLGYSRGEIVEMFGRVFQSGLVRGVMTPCFEPQKRRASPDLRGCLSAVAPRKVPARHVEVILGLAD